MRKFFITFFIFINIISFISISAVKSSFAQETAAEEDEINNYSLPYPGLLPDNPLYPLKAFRDRVVSFLITDPIKKAKFDVFEADKHLSAGLYLFKAKKITLSETSISKGENYFEDALSKIREAKREKLNIKDALKDSKLSLKVHTKYLKELEQKSPKEFRISFSYLLKRVEGLTKQVNSISP